MQRKCFSGLEFKSEKVARQKTYFKSFRPKYMFQMRRTKLLLFDRITLRVYVKKFVAQ